MPDLCLCGHYEREHTTSNLLGFVSTRCSGNTWAYPDDAETDRDGREVGCRCTGFFADATSREQKP